MVFWQKYRYLLTCLVGAVFWASPQTEAVSDNGISILVQKTLDLGKAVRPTSGSTFIYVRPNGALHTNQTTALMLDTSSVTNGQVKLTASNNGNDTITLAIDDCGNPSEYQFLSFQIKYGQENFQSSKSGLDNPGKTGTTFTHGGRLRLNKNTPTGTLSPCYTITVYYD